MNSRPRIKLKKGIHRKQEVILIEFPYDLAIIAQVRAIEGARWSPSMRCWYVPYTKQQELALKQLFKVGDLSKDIPSEKTSFIKDRGSDMNKKQVVIEKDPQTRRIYIQFPFDMAIKESIKGLDGSWWHQETKVWSVFWSPDNIKSLESIFSGRSVKWKESKTTVRKKYRTPLKEAKKHINPGF